MFVCLLATSACFQPAVGADELSPGDEPGSLFDAGVTSGDGSAGCNKTPLSSMRIRVRTTTNNGRYSPKNIGAIWIEDSAGKFVKTVEVWAKTRARYLVKWNASAKANVVDAVTGATLSMHTTHDRTWNLTGVDKCEVAQGNYKVVVEMTDKDAAGPFVEIPFMIGTTPTTLTPAEATTFHDLLVDLK